MGLSNTSARPPFFILQTLATGQARYTRATQIKQHWEALADCSLQHPKKTFNSSLALDPHYTVQQWDNPQGQKVVRFSYGVCSNACDDASFICRMGCYWLIKRTLSLSITRLKQGTWIWDVLSQQASLCCFLERRKGRWKTAVNQQQLWIGQKPPFAINQKPRNNLKYSKLFNKIKEKQQHYLETTKQILSATFLFDFLF